MKNHKCISLKVVYHIVIIYLKNMKNIRKDNTVFIELSSKLKQLFVQPTQQTAFKYDFELDTNKNESFYKSSKL